MEDNKIIELFFDRNESAINEVSIKYGKLALSVSSNILGNKEDATECVNDAYLGVWNTIPPKKPEKLLPYILKVVRNISVTRFHHNTAKKRNSNYDVAFEELEECISSKNQPESEIETKELKKIIESYLDSLSKKDRVIFMRRYWFADNSSSIAELVGMNENSVNVRLHRIRKSLHSYLLKEGVLV